MMCLNNKELSYALKLTKTTNSVTVSCVLSVYNDSVCVCVCVCVHTCDCE